MTTKELITQAIATSGMTKTQICIDAHPRMQYTMLFKLLAGQLSITHWTITRLAEALHIPVESLMGEDWDRRLGKVFVKAIKRL